MSKEGMEALVREIAEYADEYVNPSATGFMYPVELVLEGIEDEVARVMEEEDE
jgi:hypothetical protein